MKTEIAKTFYDKEIHLLNKRVVIDAEGGVKTEGYAVVDVFINSANKIQRVTFIYKFDFLTQLYYVIHSNNSFPLRSISIYIQKRCTAFAVQRFISFTQLIKCFTILFIKLKPNIIF